jgi:hypothetical protein
MVKDIRQQNAERRLRYQVWPKLTLREKFWRLVKRILVGRV